MNFLEKVLKFATDAHEGQFRKYGNNVPYITHPIAVANIVVHYKSVESVNDAEIVTAIAYLHDVLEDTDTTYNQLDRFILYATNFNYDLTNKIMVAVRLLTKSKHNFNLINYLDDIRQNKYALMIKLADLEHNMSDLKDQKKLDYYKLIEYYLTH